MNVHHIVQEALGGSNLIDNAIALCDRCHGEAGHYNPQHPIGTSYSADELKRHRDEWWKYIESNPAAALPRGPITVSPSAMPFPPAPGESHQFDLTLHNGTSAPFYGITVLSEVIGLREKEFKVDTGKPTPDEGYSVGTGRIRYPLAVDGTWLGNPATWWCWLRLDAGVTARLPLTLVVLVKPQEPAHLRVTLEAFEIDPPPLKTRPSPNDPAWTETLIRVNIADSYEWVGAAVKNTGT